MELAYLLGILALLENVSVILIKDAVDVRRQVGRLGDLLAFPSGLNCSIRLCGRSDLGRSSDLSWFGWTLSIVASEFGIFSPGVAVPGAGSGVGTLGVATDFFCLDSANVARVPFLDCTMTETLNARIKFPCRL